MIDKIEEIKESIEKAHAQSKDELENIRIKFLGGKGVIKGLFAEFKNVPNEQKKIVGQKLNELKNLAQNKINELKNAIEGASNDSKSEALDLTRPGYPFELGSRHPIPATMNEIIEIFSRIGFTVSKGPEIEDDWHNFTALNLPEDHPARDMHDTFYIALDEKNGNHISLRSHTSTVQVRVMENEKPPIRTISPGRVYRSDNDSTHLPAFHQVEGLYINENVTFADLKQTLYYFVKEMLGDLEIRFRPSYFPFTEPSAEMDIAWEINGEKKWMEILGCGMVDPNVLKNCGIDTDKYTGYAFGMGVERIAMLKYGITDIRAFYENDLRFIQQFKSVI
ncbi:MAG: phenylalanine--tRNA ligase subunit alpha [Vicingaceae bacterium]